MTRTEPASCLGLSSSAVAERIHPFGEARGNKGVYDSHRPRSSRLWTYDLFCGDLGTTRTPESFFTKDSDVAGNARVSPFFPRKDDYLLKVRCKGTRDRERLVSDMCRRAGRTEAV